VWTLIAVITAVMLAVIVILPVVGRAGEKEEIPGDLNEE